MLNLFVGTYISQRLGSVLWISMGLGLPKFMLGLVGFSFGELPLVSQAVETVATIAQVPVTFDIVPVLAYVQSLHTASISLHLLSFKALFLTVYSSISRVSCVGRLGPSLLELEEQARAGNVRGYLEILVFPEDPDLCPVRTLTAIFIR